ncbi:MAG: hypothetical protein E3J75_00640 [Dehalococcoidia bacterium]|nr:MAG: hypothetical protein E3J75_00640 [Dehalococcoidia bacterium]
MAYFFVAVSSRKNLELCVKYALAGFPNSINGVWTFSEIQEGDFISFLYGAKAHNLYRVEGKEAIKDAKNLPPWDTMTSKSSRKTYYFPFRLYLTPIRKLNESLVRAEFAYVAENLLLRGGYRKTHFQADQTTLQSASQLGELYDETADRLDLNEYEIFMPSFTESKGKVSPPEIFRFIEVILQATIRQHLSDENNLADFLYQIGVETLDTSKLEVLGEKALAEGHIDILIKEAIPIGLARKIIIEVKTGLAKLQDISQLSMYLDEMGNECLAGVLIARDFSRKILQEAKRQRISTFEYKVDIIENGVPVTFNELKEDFQLIRVT